MATVPHPSVDLHTAPTPVLHLSRLWFSGTVLIAAYLEATGHLCKAL
jgi:hypothetical protein